MIASLRGRLAAKGEDHIIVSVGGIGFKVYVPTPLLEKLANPGEEVELHTHLQVREKELSLYGCGTAEELAFFQLLLGVSGVGPKLALAILSSAPLDILRQAIVQGDVDTLFRIPGIGRKTAERLILELKGRIELERVMALPSITRVDAEVIEALTSLGYGLSEAQRALKALPQEELSLEERLFLALQYLGRGA